MDHRELIVKFYSAFQRKDWKAMIESYHPEVTFYYPAFRNLNSPGAVVAAEFIQAKTGFYTIDDLMEGIIGE